MALRVRRGFLDARDGKAAWAFMVEVALDARAQGEI